MCHEVIKNFATACILHDQVELLGGVDHFVQTHDMRMVEQFHDSDFAEELLGRGLVQLGLVYDFDGDLCAKIRRRGQAK